MRRALLAVLGASALLAGCGPNATTTTVKVPEPFGTRAASEVLRDGLVLTAVKAQLTAIDPDSATSLGVSVRDGVVRLRGTVRDAVALAKDTAAARRVGGVKQVVSEVRVDPRGPRPREQWSDFALATRITAAVAAQVGLTGVRVHVARGTATLDGTAPDAKTKATALATARGTAGIRNVVDAIRVARP
jgi:hyperosmotically inducible periplasmic protein